MTSPALTEYARLDALCTEALTHLPTLAQLHEAAAVLLPGATVDHEGEDRGHAGDSLGGRLLVVKRGDLKLTLSADWLDRRDHYGNPVEGPCAPRGVVDVRARLVNEAIEARNLELRTGRKRNGYRDAEVRYTTARDTEAGAALVNLLSTAREYGWPTLAPATIAA